MEIIQCGDCGSKLCYFDGNLNVCPECGHEWIEDNSSNNIFDSNGNELKDGDTVIVIKDLKVKGSSGSVKQGTKVKNIKIQDGDHNIACKIDGFGSMNLKSEFVKKS